MALKGTKIHTEGGGEKEMLFSWCPFLNYEEKKLLKGKKAASEQKRLLWTFKTGGTQMSSSWAVNLNRDRIVTTGELMAAQARQMDCLVSHSFCLGMIKRKRDIWMWRGTLRFEEQDVKGKKKDIRIDVWFFIQTKYALETLLTFDRTFLLMFLCKYDFLLYF